MSIPDFGTITSTLTIALHGTITDLNAQIADVRHTWDSDLTFTLIAPGGASAVLIDRRGGSSDNFIGTILDDSATTALTAGNAPFTGTFSPEEALSVFNGLDMFGTWTLRIVDGAAGDSGTLNSWGLEFAALTPTPVPEPASIALLGAGLAGLGLARRRRRR